MQIKPQSTVSTRCCSWKNENANGAPPQKIKTSPAANRNMGFFGIFSGGEVYHQKETSKL